MPDIEIACEVRARTYKALLIFDGSKECWVPKSQISDFSGTTLNEATSIFISEWLATEKGLV